MEKFFAAQQRKYEDMALPVISAPDANLAAADMTSNFHNFEAAMLNVVMNNQPGMMYWNGGDGGESEKSGDEPGLKVYSFFNATGALGIGGMFDIGIVEDSDGNTSQYLSIGWALGYGGTFGSGYSQTIYSDNLLLDDYFGWVQGISLTVGPAVGAEIYQDLSPGAVQDHRGSKYTGFGGNVGIGAGWFGYQGYTFKMNINLPKNYWSSPIHAK